MEMSKECFNVVMRAINATSEDTWKALKYTDQVAHTVMSNKVKLDRLGSSIIFMTLLNGIGFYINRRDIKRLKKEIEESKEQKG